MKKLFKNEVSLFFSKTNIFIIIICILLSLGVFKFQYVKSYDNSLENEINYLANIGSKIETWAKIYTKDYENLSESDPNSKLLEELEIKSTVFSKENLNIGNLKPYLNIKEKEILEKNKDRIITNRRKLDTELIPLYENEYDVEDTGVYRDSIRDWKNRNRLWDINEEKNIEQTIFQNKPTGGYILKDSLSGSSFLSVLFLFLSIFLNYDIWSSEFDQGTIRMIYTQPFSRKKIYLARYLTRLLLTIFCILIILGILFSIGSIIYGNGLDSFDIVNKKAISSFGQFDNSNNYLSEMDMVMNIKEIIGLELILFISYIVFFTSTIHFLSYLTENGLSSLLISFLIVMGIIMFGYLPRENMGVGFNPLLYFQTHNGIMGSLGIGLPIMIAILFLAAIIINAVSIFVLIERERA